MKKMSDFSEDLHKRIAEADGERLHGYIEMFDRLLLYNMAIGILPPEHISEIITRWEQAMKMTINSESKLRTHFLESTPQGRIAKKQKQPDGEDLRLLFLNTLDTAKQMVTRNLKRDQDDEVDYHS